MSSISLKYIIKIPHKKSSNIFNPELVNQILLVKDEYYLRKRMNYLFSLLLNFVEFKQTAMNFIDGVTNKGWRTLIWNCFLIAL